MEPSRKPFAAAGIGAAASAADPAVLPAGGTGPRAAGMSAAATAAPAPETAAVPVRRVGTFTMGVALIAAGVVLCLSLFFPHFNYAYVCRFAPLLLVLLGVEVLVGASRAGSARIRYDVLSMFVCALLIVCALGATVFAAYCLQFGISR